MKALITVSVVNEDCFLLSLGEKIDLSFTSRIALLVKQIEAELNEALVDITPSYTTILVQVNLLKIAPLVAEQQLRQICEATLTAQVLAGKRIKLPVYYDISVGWDLQKVAIEKGIPIHDVINLHSEKIYQVCAVGFAPGFAFLAELEDELALPRYASPRAFVPAGSVAIADKQTAVYPSDSPGGWNLIGNCPTLLFDINKTPISPFSIGDRVSFYAISLQEFIDLGGKVIAEQ